MKTTRIYSLDVLEVSFSSRGLKSRWAELVLSGSFCSPASSSGSRGRPDASACGPSLRPDTVLSPLLRALSPPAPTNISDCISTDTQDSLPISAAIAPSQSHLRSRFGRVRKHSQVTGIGGVHAIGDTSMFGDGKKAEAEKEAQVRSRRVRRVYGHLAASNLGERGMLEEKGVAGLGKLPLPGESSVPRAVPGACWVLSKGLLNE